ncbi:MAG: hypothetical protein ABIH00_05790 [Armatimonadota bacterium]
MGDNAIQTAHADYHNHYSGSVGSSQNGDNEYSAYNDYWKKRAEQMKAINDAINTMKEAAIACFQSQTKQNQSIADKTRSFLG